MVHYAVLGSGSNGNSYAISDGTRTLLVDQGFSLVELKRRLSLFDIPFSSVVGCCVTHLHPDHVHGLGTFARKTGLPVWLNHAMVKKEPVVFQRLNLPENTIRLVAPDSPFDEGPFHLTCMSTSHDSGGSVCWEIGVADRRLMVLTDTGVTTEEQLSCARTADVLFLEANYDEEMLAEGPYPLALKRRIAGKWGHLSNAEALAFLSHSGFHGERVYFIHLSSTNNNPGLLAMQAGGLYHGPFTVCEKGKCYEGRLA